MTSNSARFHWIMMCNIMMQNYCCNASLSSFLATQSTGTVKAWIDTHHPFGPLVNDHIRSQNMKNKQNKKLNSNHFLNYTHHFLTMKKLNALYFNFNFCILKQKSNRHSFFVFNTREENNTPSVTYLGLSLMDGSYREPHLGGRGDLWPLASNSLFAKH